MLERAAQIVDDYGFLNMVVHSQIDSLTHAESLLQLPFDTNCLNWVFGHIVTNRSLVLEVAGVQHAWGEEVRALYHTDTPPIKPASKVLKFEKLTGHLDESVGLLKAALENVSEGWLLENFTNYRGEKTRERHFKGFHWHESYHIGQLEIFKDMALAARKPE
jgi:hypothetical protein